MTKLDNIEHNIKSFSNWYFTLSGRIGRMTFFQWSVALVIIEKVITNDPQGMVSENTILFISLVFLALRIPLIVRRLHDIGLSGYFYLLFLIPLILEGPITAIALIVFYGVLLFYPGSALSNKYGPTLIKKKHQ